jgi:ABC-type dipeptide/oligopeptide/nickel transport system permease subunit
LVAPFDPLVQHRESVLVPPGQRFLLGTDELGRDVLSRVIFGARASLVAGGLAVVLGAVIGISSGLVAGYRGGAVDTIIMRSHDALLAFPAILLGMAVVAVLGPGSLKVAIAIAIAQAPIFARLARSLALGEREKEYIEAATAMGASSKRVIFSHILPNSSGPLVIQTALSMSFAVLAEASLSFLGLGVQPPQPSWGQMLSDSLQFLRDAPWYGIFPGAALTLMLVGLNFTADGLRDALDPGSGDRI